MLWLGTAAIIRVFVQVTMLPISRNQRNKTSFSL